MVTWNLKNNAHLLGYQLFSITYFMDEWLNYLCMLSEYSAFLLAMPKINTCIITLPIYFNPKNSFMWSSNVTGGCGRIFCILAKYWWNFGLTDVSFMQGEDIHGVPGLINLFGIESPGLTSSMAIADFISTRFLGWCSVELVDTWHHGKAKLLLHMKY